MRIGQTSFVHLVSRFAMAVAGFFGNLYFARVLGKDLLGQYFLIVSTMMWVSIAVKAGVPNAVSKRLSERDGGSEYFFAGLGTIGVCFSLVAIVIYLFRSQLFSYLEADYLVLFLLVLLFGVLFDFFQAVLNGQHKVHLSSLLIPTERVSRIVFQVGFVLLGFELLGLLVGYVVAGLLVVAVGLVLVNLELAIPDRSEFRSLFQFSKYSWVTSVKGRAFHALDTVALGFFVPTGLIGIYVIAWNLSTFFAMFSDGIGRAIFPEISAAASAGNRDEVEQFLDGALAFSGLFVIPGFVGAALLGDEVLAIYGSGFAKGQAVLLLLIAANLFSVYETQYMAVFNGLDRPDIAFRVQASYIAVNLILNPLLIWTVGWTGAAIATSSSMGVGLALGYLYAGTLVDVRFPWSAIVKQMLAAAAMGLCVYILDDLLADNLPTLISLIGTGATIYFVVLLGISGRFRQAVRNNLPP